MKTFTLKASSSVLSSPINIGSTSSRVFNPAKFWILDEDTQENSLRSSKKEIQKKKMTITERFKQKFNCFSLVPINYWTDL